MNQNKHINHYRRHMTISYPVSIHQRLYSLVVVPLLVLVVVFVVIQLLGKSLYHPSAGVSLNYILLALVATYARLIFAFALALVVALPLSVLVNKSPQAERILLPLFDIIQSVPVLAFFPVIIVFFIHYNFFEGAAIFVLSLSMLWNIVFSVVGGLHIVPQEIKDAAKIFHVRGWQYFKRVLIPSIVPYLVTGSLLAFAQGWNIVIVAEVLHTYIPGGTPAQDLFGIGNLLVSSSASGDQHVFILAIFCMIIFIGLLNFFVWQKLLHYAEKFKFE